MTDHVMRHVIPAAMSLLPERMDTPAARAMLICIGLQESRFKHRVQVHGPAHGFWQFELHGGVMGVLTHPATALVIVRPLQVLGYSATLRDCYAAIVDNDTLACVFARLLLWTVPGRVATADEPDKAWHDYLAGWRPGKPHRETWNAFFLDAWQMVKEGTE